MLEPRGLCKAADHKAVITSMSYLMPIVKALFSVAVPLECSGIIEPLVSHPLPRTMGDRLTRAVFCTLFTDLTVFDDAPGGLGTLGKGYICKNLADPNQGASLPGDKAAVTSQMAQTSLDCDGDAKSSVVATGDCVVTEASNELGDMTCK